MITIILGRSIISRYVASEKIFKANMSLEICL